MIVQRMITKLKNAIKNGTNHWVFRKHASTNIRRRLFWRHIHKCYNMPRHSIIYLFICNLTFNISDSENQSKLWPIKTKIRKECGRKQCGLRWGTISQFARGTIGNHGTPVTTVGVSCKTSEPGTYRERNTSAIHPTATSGECCLNYDQHRTGSLRLKPV